MKASPLVAVEVIEERDDLRIIESLVAEPLPHVSPVLLFDMSIVIFVVGARASKLDGTFSLRKVF